MRSKEGRAIATGVVVGGSLLTIGLLLWAVFGASASRRPDAGAPPCAPRPVVGGADEVLVWAALRRLAPKSCYVLPQVPLDAIVGGVGGPAARARVRAFAAGHRADFVVVDGTTARPLHVVQVVRMDRDRRRVPPDAAVGAACTQARLPLLQLETGLVEWESTIRAALAGAHAVRDGARGAGGAARGQGQARPTVARAGSVGAPLR